MSILYIQIASSWSFYIHNSILQTITGLYDPNMIKNKKGQAFDSTMKPVSPDRQASGLMKCYTHTREDR